MAEAERSLLADEAHGAGGAKIGFQLLEQGGLALQTEAVLQLIRPVEIVLDRRLVAPGNEDDVLDPGGQSFVDDVLNCRPVEHRKHFFRDSFGCRQHPGT